MRNRRRILAVSLLLVAIGGVLLWRKRVATKPLPFPRPPGARTLRFPKDYSVGRLSSCDWGIPYDFFKPTRQDLGEAQGTIEVPAGAEVHLRIVRGSEQAGPSFWRRLTMRLGLKMSPPDSRLDLSFLADLGPHDIQRIELQTPSQIRKDSLRYLKRFRSLHTLDLYACPIYDTHLSDLRGQASIRTLILNETRITDQGLGHLKHLPSLQELRLHATKIDGGGLIHCADMKSLERLNLGSTRLSDAALVHLGRVKTLKALRLSQTKITGEGLKDLAPLPLLEYLDLSGTQITDASLAHLPAVPSLEGLDISYTKISDAAIPHLKKHTGLRFLSFAGTRISDAGCDELRRAFPDAFTEGTYKHFKREWRMSQLRVD